MPVVRQKNQTHQSILTMNEGDLAHQRNARHMCNPISTSTSTFIISVTPIWSHNYITKFPSLFTVSELNIGWLNLRYSMSLIYCISYLYYVPNVSKLLCPIGFKDDESRLAPHPFLL